MSYHFFAMFLGFVLDLLFGDPHWLPHPIRLIGNLIASLEKLNKKELSDTKKFLRGFAMVVVVIAWTTGVAAVILEGAYGLHPAIGCAMEAIMTYQILATKCLKVESMKVYEQLQKQDLPAARKAVSMIVGRDTEQLDETGVAKAAIAVSYTHLIEIHIFELFPLTQKWKHTQQENSGYGHKNKGSSFSRILDFILVFC